MWSRAGFALHLVLHFSMVTGVTGLALGVGSPAPCYGSNTPSLHFSEAEFRQIAIELAQKVDLFQDIWALDPDAVLTAGVVRDFLYFVRQKLARSSSLEELRKIERIELKEFMLEESDVDLVSTQWDFSTIVPKNYGFDRLDRVTPDRFTPGKPHYRTEHDQGYIPIEKLMLGKTTISSPSAFGDGFHEIYTGKPTIWIPDNAMFNATYFAGLGANHLVLLVMRYVRTLSLNFAKTGATDIQGDFANIPAPIIERMQEIASSSLHSMFMNSKFAEWYRKGVDRAFRGGGSTKYTFQLFQKLGLDLVVAKWPEQSPPILHYLQAAEAVSAAELKALYLSFAQTSSTPEEMWSVARAIAHPRYHAWTDLVSQEPSLSLAERGAIAVHGLALILALELPQDVVLSVFSDVDAALKYFEVLVRLPLNGPLGVTFQSLVKAYPWPDLVYLDRSLIQDVVAQKAAVIWPIFWREFKWNSLGTAFEEYQKSREVDRLRNLLAELLSQRCNAMLQKPPSS